MTIEVHQRAFQPQINEGILDVLGLATPSFVLSMLHATPDCLFLLNEVGEVIYVNEHGLRRVCHTSFDQARGAHWASFFPPSARRELLRAVQLAAQGEQVHCEIAEPGSMEGQLLSMTIAPVFLRDGSVECLCVVGRRLSANTNARPAESS
ncbi:PAS domain-containing protein [Primorskyibacter sp. S187A]|uniref:PAS domain-containing protein n=1 Tax=Primorskyibacter sp. S187A TaxID=3415130 RepID=UPI003C7C87B0